jgi:hypothetical protein
MKKIILFIFISMVGVSFSTSAYADGDDVFGAILGTLGAIAIINSVGNQPVYVQPQPYYNPPPVVIQQPTYQPYYNPYYQPYYNAPPPVVYYGRGDDDERYDR